ncbi:MAG: 50S ribosomal protein L18 [Candidatus Micrarchaeota archaeon]
MTQAKTPKYVVHFRRRREGVTNYAKRLGLIKGATTRMVVRKSNKSVLVQFVDFDPKGDLTRLSVTSQKLSKDFSWPSKRNTLTAYLTGLLAGKMAQKKKISEFILDMGMITPSKGSIVFAALKGAVDAGLKTNYQESKIAMDKISKPAETIAATFDKVKKQIMGM